MKITKRKAKGVLADMIANMDEDSLARTREKMINMKEQQETKTRLQEDYCSKDVKNLLVTKGFIGDMWYNNDDIHISHALAMKWLREVKEIYINVRNTVIEPLYDGELHFVVDILDRGKGEWVDNDIWGNSYEEAVEAALKYSLENLI